MAIIKIELSNSCYYTCNSCAEWRRDVWRAGEWCGKTNGVNKSRLVVASVVHLIYHYFLFSSRYLYHFFMGFSSQMELDQTSLEHYRAYAVVHIWCQAQWRGQGGGGVCRLFFFFSDSWWREGLAYCEFITVYVCGYRRIKFVFGLWLSMTNCDSWFYVCLSCLLSDFISP